MSQGARASGASNNAPAGAVARAASEASFGTALKTRGGRPAIADAHTTAAPKAAIPVPCPRQLDRSPVRRAQISALPLVLALVEFRGVYAAVFREQPLERSKDRAISMSRDRRTRRRAP